MTLLGFIRIISIGRINLVPYYHEAVDGFFWNVFGMTYMDSQGFRSQRTKMQLNLESIPQIVIQVYLVFRIQSLDPAEAMVLDIGWKPILISLSFAVIHLILEVFNLYFESSTSGSFPMHYMMSCYNARQGWIPQQHDFDIADGETSSVIEFDNKEKMFCFEKLGYSVPFEFTEQSLNTLEGIISSLPK